MSESKWKQQEMMELLSQAAPIISIMAYKGGSIFAKDWVDKVRALGIEVLAPEADNESEIDAE